MNTQMPMLFKYIHMTFDLVYRIWISFVRFKGHLDDPDMYSFLSWTHSLCQLKLSKLVMAVGNYLSALVQWGIRQVAHNNFQTKGILASFGEQSRNSNWGLVILG